MQRGGGGDGAGVGEDGDRSGPPGNGEANRGPQRVRAVTVSPTAATA